MKRLIILIAILVVVLVVVSAAQQYFPIFRSAQLHLASQNSQPVRVVSEESVTIDIVKKYGPSVVTVSGTASQSQQQSPFDFGLPPFFGVNPGGPNIQQPNQNQADAIGS